jgi:hypothetical protein
MQCLDFAVHRPSCLFFGAIIWPTCLSARVLSQLLWLKILTLVIGIRPVLLRRHAVAQLVEALRYKLEGRGFDSRRCHWNFSLT